ncbi:hypothetical protein ACA910_014538 [Epithemia clementina (nom. ined.)]
MAGMSRASKKRAKKKQKQLVQSDQASVSDQQVRGCVDSSVGDDEAPTELDVNSNHDDAKKRKHEDGSDAEEEADTNKDATVNDNTEDGQANGDSNINEPEKKRKSKAEKTDVFACDQQVKPPRDCTLLLDIIEARENAELAKMTARQRANCVLNFLLQPAGISAKEFYEEYWEQEALLIQQSLSKHRHRFDGLLSLKQIREMLAQNSMCYGRDLNVTRYEQDKHGVMRRTTFDLVKSSASKSKDDDSAEPDFVVAEPEVVWTQYQQGCTVRLLCPHKHCDPVHSLLHLMELEFGCMVGANAYLTPPESAQGFAPHYDDIEAFCLQLEGRKRWKVYAPLSKGESLPRQSSHDFVEKDLENVKPVMDVILSPGDVLYMPRGWIHQACTFPGGTPKDGHSLHLTVSAMQQWAWVDLLEIVLPEALNAAAASVSSTALREGLPIRFLDYMGAAHSNRDVPELLKGKLEEVAPEPEEQRIRELQENFRNEAKARIMRVAKEAMDLLDASCDQISKQFISSCQPPALSKTELLATSAGQKRAVKIEPQMLVRLVRPGVARLVLEDGKAVIYHCLDNSREYHGRPIHPLEFELDDGPALEQLLQTTEPRWISVDGLFHDTIEDKVGVTQALYDEGLLMMRDE